MAASTASITSFFGKFFSSQIWFIAAINGEIGKVAPFSRKSQNLNCFIGNRRRDDFKIFEFDVCLLIIFLYKIYFTKLDGAGPSVLLNYIKKFLAMSIDDSQSRFNNYI